MDCIVHGVAESDTTERLSLSLSFLTCYYCIFIIFQWFLLYYIIFFNVSHFSSYCEGNGLITEGEVYFNDFLILGGGG